MFIIYHTGMVVAYTTTSSKTMNMCITLVVEKRPTLPPTISFQFKMPENLSQSRH